MKSSSPKVVNIKFLTISLIKKRNPTKYDNKRTNKSNKLLKYVSGENVKLKYTK